MLRIRWPGEEQTHTKLLREATQEEIRYDSVNEEMHAGYAVYLSCCADCLYQAEILYALEEAPHTWTIDLQGNEVCEVCGFVRKQE